MSLLGGLIGAVGSLFGSKIGADAQLKGGKKAARATLKANAQNIAYQRQFARSGYLPLIAQPSHPISAIDLILS